MTKNVCELQQQEAAEEEVQKESYEEENVTGKF